MTLRHQAVGGVEDAFALHAHFSRWVPPANWQVLECVNYSSESRKTHVSTGNTTFEDKPRKTGYSAVITSLIEDKSCLSKEELLEVLAFASHTTLNGLLISFVLLHDSDDLFSALEWPRVRGNQQNLNVKEVVAKRVASPDLVYAKEAERRLIFLLHYLFNVWNKDFLNCTRFNVALREWTSTILWVFPLGFDGLSPGMGSVVILKVWSLAKVKVHTLDGKLLELNFKIFDLLLKIINLIACRLNLVLQLSHFI